MLSDSSFGYLYRQTEKLFWIFVSQNDALGRESTLRKFYGNPDVPIVIKIYNVSAKLLTAIFETKLQVRYSNTYVNHYREVVLLSFTMSTVVVTFVLDRCHYGITPTHYYIIYTQSLGYTCMAASQSKTIFMLALLRRY